MPYKEIKLVEPLRDRILMRGDLSLRRLAREADVGLWSIERFLAGGGISLLTAEKLYNALQRHYERSDRTEAKQ
jgi:hypothetical protein